MINYQKIWFSFYAGLPNLFTGTGHICGRKVIAATCIFTKIKLQIIASLLYKIGAHFGQYFGYLSQKLGGDQKKKKKGLHRKSELISGEPNRRKFWFGPFYFPENAK